MAAPHGAVAAALLLALTGCVNAVELGSQCGAEGAECGPGIKPTDPGAPLIALDASMVSVPISKPVEPPDSATVETAPDGGQIVVVGPTVGLDAGSNNGAHGIMPALTNDSFEITRGAPGGLAYSPIDPVPLGLTVSEPWSACGFGNSALASADSMRGSGKGDVLPTNGDNFIEANLGVPAFQGIRQTLSTPLKEGVRYAFMIDVRAAQGADVGLEFWGSFVDCVGSNKLNDVGQVPEYWQSVCVVFVPQMDYPELFLQPSIRSSNTNGDLRVFFDNLRSDPNCY